MGASSLLHYSTVVQQQISQCATSTKQRIDALCSMDLQPYTQNQEYYDTCRRKIYLQYKTLYEKSQPSGTARGFIDLLQSNTTARGLIDNMLGPELIAVLEGLARLGLPSPQPMHLAALLPTDEFDPALVVMADVRAYFQGKSLLFRYRYFIGTNLSISLSSCVQTLYRCDTQIRRPRVLTGFRIFRRYRAQTDGSEHGAVRSVFAGGTGGQPTSQRPSWKEETFGCREREARHDIHV